MAKVVSIINLKGGVGKSTLTMMFSEYLAFRYNKRVLVIDMDSQANLTYAMVSQNAVKTQRDKQRTTYHFFKQAIANKKSNIPEFVARPPLAVCNIARWTLDSTQACLDMIISIPDMAELDEDMLLTPYRATPEHLRQSLRLSLDEIRDEYDYVLIDCPPGLSIFSSAALIASDYFLSPIIPEPLSLQGVDLIQKRITRLRDNFPTPQFAGVVLNIVKLHRTTHKIIATRLYESEQGTYRPFLFWLPDNENLRKLGDFEVELLSDQTAWGGAREDKFSTLYQKYGLSYKLTNPQDPVLGRHDKEGVKYKMEERISSLTEELMERVSGRVSKR